MFPVERDGINWFSPISVLALSKIRVPLRRVCVSPCEVNEVCPLDYSSTTLSAITWNCGELVHCTKYYLTIGTQFCVTSSLIGLALELLSC